MKLKLILSLLFLGICSQAAIAYDFEVDGLYFNILSASANTCELTSGDHPYSGNIIIPEEVTINNRLLSVKQIGDYAFNDATEINILSIPGSVEIIGAYAFKTSLPIDTLIFKNSDIPLEINSFIDGPYFDSPRRSAFYRISPLNILIDRDITGTHFSGKTSIVSLTIGSNINHFNSSTFNNCTNLNTFILEDSPETFTFDYVWGQDQFYKCPLQTVALGRNFTFYHDSRNDLSPFESKSIETLKLGDYVTSLEAESFRGCRLLKNIDLKNIEKIESRTFYECESLTNLNLPNTLLSIGSSAFYGCISINEISLGESLSEIKEDAFYGCKQIKKIFFPMELKRIERSAFSSCTSLSEIQFSDNIEYIGDRAFSSCPIVVVALPEYLIELGDAFRFCPDIKYLSIGSKIKTIASKTFIESENIDEIKITAPIPPSIQDDTFNNKTYLNSNLYIPYNTLNIYYESTWHNFWNIEDSLPAPIEIEKIELNIEEVELNLEETIQLTATISPDEEGYNGIIWSSTDEKIASVNSEGLITANTPGECVIMASSEFDPSVYAECKVTVNEDAGVVLIPDKEENLTVYNIEGIIVMKGVTKDKLIDLKKGIYFVKTQKGNTYKIVR